MTAKLVNPLIFKAYDIRGIYPTEITEGAAEQIGRAFVSYLGARRIAVGRDMRLSSPVLTDAFIQGALAQGSDVVDFGLISTDMLYYSVARDEFDGGAEITASHNPKQYNGMKLVRQQAVPLSSDAGLSEIRELILKDKLPAPSRSPGHYSQASILDDYIQHVLSFIDTSIIKPFTLVLDAGSGMAGLVAPRLFEHLPCSTSRLCFAIDGTFPVHEANPLIAANRRDVAERVVDIKADAGIAWDGDADRCFFIDDDGGFVPGDFITALLAEAFLRKYPAEKILYDVRASYAIKDLVARNGGTSLMNRVGHAFFKKRMRDEHAVFGGEVTGHYYFRENYFADNGFIPALLVLELMSVRGQSLTDLLTPLREKYFISGEINTEMPDMEAAKRTIDELTAKYSDGHVYRMDGVSVEYQDWHFNVRPSNTEPLIRLNLEATTRTLMSAKRDEILDFIRR